MNPKITQISEFRTHHQKPAAEVSTTSKLLHCRDAFCQLNMMGYCTVIDWENEKPPEHPEIPGGCSAYRSRFAPLPKSSK